MEHGAYTHPCVSRVQFRARARSRAKKKKKNCSKVSASAVQSTDVWWVDQRREGVFRSSPEKATTNLPGRLVISGVINYRHQHH